MHLIYDHRTHPAQALFAADDLIYALISPGDDIRIQTLGDLAAPPQPDAADTYPNGGLKAKFPIGRELIELLVGQSHQGHQKEQLSFSFQQILNPGYLSDKALSRGRGRDHQLMPPLQEAGFNRAGLHRQKPVQPAL